MAIISAEGFSTALPQGPFPYGDPKAIALGKASQCPDEGGPAIVEIEVPAEIVDLANDFRGEIRFESGGGLEELLAAWPAIRKRIL